MENEIKLAAVIVLYQERLEDSATYLSLLKQANIPVLVYDNSPTSQAIKIKELFTYISDTSNSGVSAAYNKAWRWAVQNDYTHLLLLDSDSTFPENAWNEYLSAANKHKEKLILPAMISKERKISPFYFKSGKSHYGDGIKSGIIEMGNIVAINSGLLVPIPVLNKVDGFNELLPLDWSDVYFIRKAAALHVKGFHIELQVRHGLSEHNETSLKSAKFRFKLQLDGIKLVALSTKERYQMYFWMALKSIKLTLKLRSSWFLVRFLKQ